MLSVPSPPHCTARHCSPGQPRCLHLSSPDDRHNHPRVAACVAGGCTSSVSARRQASAGAPPAPPSATMPIGPQCHDAQWDGLPAGSCCCTRRGAQQGPATQHSPAMPCAWTPVLLCPCALLQGDCLWGCVQHAPLSWRHLPAAKTAACTLLHSSAHACKHPGCACNPSYACCINDGLLCKRHLFGCATPCGALWYAAVCCTIPNLLVCAVHVSYVLGDTCWMESQLHSLHHLAWLGAAWLGALTGPSAWVGALTGPCCMIQYLSTGTLS